MLPIIKTELYKLKRYHILISGIALMLLTVVLTLFTSTAIDGSYWDFRNFIEQIIKNNMSMTFPMCISLITGYIIAREVKDDTLKNIQVISIPYRKMMTGKLILGALIAILLGIICVVFTLVAQAIIKFPGFTFDLAIKGSAQIIVNCFFLYLAVLPIIIITSRFLGGHMLAVIISLIYGYGGMFAVGNMTLASIYPISASLGMINYRSYDPGVSWNIYLSTMSFVFILILSAILIMTSKKSLEQSNNRKKKKKAIKKGW